MHEDNMTSYGELFRSKVIFFTENFVVNVAFDSWKTKDYSVAKCVINEIGPLL